MKKIKLLGVLAIALTLGLAACNSSGNASSGSGKGSSSKHVHTFDTTKWESDDTAHWHPATCEHTSQKGDKADHDFGEPYDVVQPDCEQAGSQKVKCKICNKEVTQTIEAKGHTWGEWEIVTAAECETAGERKHKCTVCNKEETEVIEALGHTYAKDPETGEDLVNWTSAPTCTEAGVGSKECTVCHKSVEVTKEALGHDIQLVDDGSEPEAGKAKVRMYTCSHGCGTSYFGFKASEVTEASKSHLVIGDDGGARFWGRPIGNDVTLNDSGDPDENSHEAVFNDQQTGDFFEYVFDLTDEQAGDFYCYCDATPAQWMRNNNMDFFACKPGDTDWTRGMYIDDVPGTEENEKGTDIDDYRYILYVDDQPVSFDDTITNPVRSDNRGEYVIPYLFHLHAGTNKISLRMAGGYRSTFYNFTFRAVLPEPVVDGE